MQVESDVLAVLSRAQTNDRALVLTERLDRKMYQRTNKVLEAAGGKWDRKAKAHLFDGDAAERIDEIILTGSVEVPKAEFGFFPTPSPVVNRLLELAEIQPGMRVLEPSAGTGAIALAIACITPPDCIELMEANYKVLAGEPSLGLVRRGDFLEQPPEPVYDRVVMNPPFARQADIKHVRHALGFLKPDGLLVSVMAAGITFRDNKLTRDFRELVGDRGGEIEPLPDGAFKDSGTMVRAVIVTIPGAKGG